MLFSFPIDNRKGVIIMSQFNFDIQGQLNSMQLASSKALWPLFEAVVNSIQSIEDSPNHGKGKISIFAHREKTRIADPVLERTFLEKIEAFSITDNGNGLDEKNYQSFNTAYSTLKFQKGCKGIGRFVWLKSFNSVTIDSVFCKDAVYYSRKFMFSPAGISPEENISVTTNSTLQTKITLNDYKQPYKAQCPVELDVIAKKIIEHCLLFFISDNCPEITISDGVSDTVNLNQYFEANIKDSLHQDHFSIKDNNFVLYHLRIPEGANKHELHLCADMHEVKSIELKKYVPNLHKKITPIDNPNGFYYVGYLTGDYLNQIANSTRTAFEFDESENQIGIIGTGSDTLVSQAISFISGYLSDYLQDIEKRKVKRIDEFVQQGRPTYRYLLSNKPEVYSKIPSGLSNSELELELHKQVQKWEDDIKEQGILLEKTVEQGIQEIDSNYQKIFETYWSGITELSKTSLAEYVTRRKTILKLLEDTLTITDSGKFKNEDAIHSIICPMRHTSDDVEFEEMNLWLVDERLAYHKFLASDKTLKSMPVIDTQSKKEPDIAIFDQAFAYSDNDEPFSSITIIEFKKPDNDSKNPINQVGEYIDLIRTGKKKKTNGQSFNVTDGTIFRCYIICDLTDKMRTHCMNGGLFPTADNMGYAGYNPGRRSYIEVISYNKLLSDAKKRNDILFDKLFTPKPGKILH